MKRIEPGALLVDRFVVENFVGRGGMSTVYRAHDRATNRAVALKFFDGGDEESIGRFDREARVLASLSHSAIVEHVTSGHFESHRYLAMEWLEGKDLSQLLVDGPLTIEATVELAVGIASALAAAHRAGVVHRDIKPANIFLMGGDPTRPKLLDFGIARAAMSPRLTKLGEALGTPAYMAPEQARGAQVDSAADIFSLGCVIFESLTGKPPFWADHPLAVMAKILLEDAPPLSQRVPSAPRSLVDLVQRMLSKDPAQRPANGAELGKLLKELRESIGHSDRGQSQSDPPPASITTHERRLLSVLFVSNIAATQQASIATTEQSPLSITEGNSSELLYADVMSHGGWAERLIDGTVVVTIPGTGAPSEQAARAAKCALAIRKSLPSSPVVLVTGRADITGGFPVGEVIDRGVAMLHDLGPLDETQVAPDQRGVVVDEITAGLLDQRFDMEASVGGFRIIAESHAFEAGTLLGQASSLVGRDRELNRFMELFRATVAHTCAQVLLITGASGVGKSRLVTEMAGSLVDDRSSPTIAWARGHQADRHVPLRLIARLLSSFFGLVDGESKHSLRHRIRARVGRNVPEADVDRVSAFLGELVGVRFQDHALLAVVREDPVRLGDQIRAAINDFLFAEILAAPVILLVDDLHLADAASVSLLDSMLRFFAESPLLVVGVARPDIDDLFPDLWETRPLVRFGLLRLDTKSASVLVEEALKNRKASQAEMQRIVHEADGNVLHLEELIRAFHEGRGGKLPETVVGIVQVRLEGLSPEARRALRACAILGDAFTVDAVKALLGDRRANVPDSLDRLVRAEFLSTGSMQADKPTFSFRSATILDAAYESLTEEDRRLGHRLAADWTELNGSSRDAVLVAHHREKGSQGEKAVTWYARAAAVALESNDFAAAVERAKRGLSLRSDAPLKGKLFVLQSEAHRHLGENAQLFACSKEALDALPDFSPAWWTAFANAVLASIRLGLTAETDALCRRLTSSALVDLPADAARAAHYLLFSGRERSADPILIAAMQYIGPFAEDSAKWAWGYRAHASRALLIGDSATYLEQLELAVTAFASAGDMRNLASERVNLGFAHLEMGNYALSKKVLDEARTVALSLGLRHVVSAADSNLGGALLRLGQFGEAIVSLVRAETEFSQQGNRRMEGNTRNYHARVLQKLGRFEEALVEIMRAEELLSTVPTLMPSAVAVRGRILLAMGRHEEASLAVRTAKTLLETTGRLDEGEAMVRLAFVEVCAATGHKQAASDAIRAARDRLLARAQSIRNDAWRQTFLEVVEENRRTLDLARILA